jgi:hypothetical protein
MEFEKKMAVAWHLHLTFSLTAINNELLELGKLNFLLR